MTAFAPKSVSPSRWIRQRLIELSERAKRRPERARLIKKKDIDSHSLRTSAHIIDRETTARSLDKQMERLRQRESHRKGMRKT